MGALVVISALSLTACGANAATNSPPETVEAVNTDPKIGPVYIRTINHAGSNMATIKFCDGTTLVYNFIGARRGGGDTIADSPECTSDAPEPPS